jgi:hypothetical protein
MIWIGVGRRQATTVRAGQRVLLGSYDVLNNLDRAERAMSSLVQRRTRQSVHLLVRCIPQIDPTGPPPRRLRWT